MGNIRKQTIVSSILIYAGFAIGALNIYFYTAQTPLAIYPHGQTFAPDQYGLTRVFFDFSQIAFNFGALGVIPVVYKFYPYYKDNLPEKDIDLTSWALVIATIGFLFVLLGGWIFKPLMVRKFSEKSRLLIDYYFWLFPFIAGMLFFSVLESFAWALHKSVLSNFLKETGFRILTTILIALYFLHLIDYTWFIYLFSLQYLVVFGILLIYLIRTGRLRLHFRIIRVTRKLLKKMVSMQALLYSGTCIVALAATIDSIIIAGLKGLGTAGIFVFAQYAANLIQAPQRSILSISAGVLSRSWKEKNYQEINRVYARSCINLLLLSLLVFGNLWLNILPAIDVLHLQSVYKDGIATLFVLGMVRIVDAGTGLNAMVINTSTFWRFDFYSGVVLLILRLPLTFYLITKYGIIGSAFAELIAYSIYNFIRYEFLRRKFNMQPFNLKTLFAIIWSVSCYLLTWWMLHKMGGWTGLFLRSILFSGLMFAGIFYFRFTPDAHQLYETWRKRMGKK